MEEMGKKPSDEELEKFMKEVDLDGNGTVGLSSLPSSSLLRPPPCCLSPSCDQQPEPMCCRSSTCANKLIIYCCSDLGEFNHMIRNQLGIGHTCVCKFCEAKKKEEEEANAAVIAMSLH
jgi:hypothetical protein